MSEETVLALLDPRHVQTLWPRFGHGLQKSNMLEFWDEENLLEGCMTGGVQCWTCSMKEDKEVELILFTDIHKYSRGVKALRFIGGFGGNIDTYLPTIVDTFKKILGSLECNKVEVLGRKGWEKKLKALGFSHSHSVYVRWLDTPSLRIN